MRRKSMFKVISRMKTSKATSNKERMLKSLIEALNETVKAEKLTLKPDDKGNLQGLNGFGLTIHQKVKQLRDERKISNYEVEVTREWGFDSQEKIEEVPITVQGKRIEQSLVTSRTAKAVAITKIAPVKFKDDKETKITIVKRLLAEINNDIRIKRKEIKKGSIVDNEPTFYDRPELKGLKVPMRTGLFIEPNALYNVLKHKWKLDMLAGKSRQPAFTHVNYVGVEIELMSKKTKEFIGDIMHNADMSKYVSIFRDGSIHPTQEEIDAGYQYQHEIRLLLPQPEYAVLTKKFCNLLNDHCQVKVNKTCGLHVHVDMRKRNKDSCGNNLKLMQHFLYAMVPLSRRTGTYSKPIPKDMQRGAEHHDGVSLSAYEKHRTIEVRMHSGTTNADKIINWIAFLLAIVDGPLIEYEINDMQVMFETFNINNGLREYIESRINKFKALQKEKKVKVNDGEVDLSKIKNLPDSTPNEDSEVA